MIFPIKRDEIWQLVDEVEPEIRREYEKWANIMSR